MANKIGSDVMLGIEKKNLILQGNRKLFRSNKKIGLYTIIIKPNFGYSTEKIYKNIKSFSKPALNKNKNKLFSVSNIISLDRKSVVQGKSVDLGGRRIIKKKTTTIKN